MGRNSGVAGSSQRRRWAVRVIVPILGVAFAVGVPLGAAWASNSIPVGTELPIPADAGPVPGVQANSVTCTSEGTCVAVGEYLDEIGLTHSMETELSSGEWSPLEVYAPTNAPDYTYSQLNGVACVSAGNCVAVGEYRISTVDDQGFYVLENSGTWGRGVELPLPSDASTDPAEASFDSVSCISSGETTGTCMLLGAYDTTSDTTNAVVDTLNFGTGDITGSPVEISPLAGQDSIELGSISCADVNDCVAVGSQGTEDSNEATYVLDTSDVWQSPVLVDNSAGSSSPEEYLSSVSCVSVGNCVAGGAYGDNNGNFFAETYTEASGLWDAPVTLGAPSNLGDPTLDSISCATSIQTCTATGGLSDNEGNLYAAAAQMTDGTWGQLAVDSIPSGGVPDSELLSVSCTAGTACTAVGYYNDDTGDTEGLAASWVPGLPPGPVTDLQVSATSHTSVQLSWVAPIDTGTGISHFEVLGNQIGHATSDIGPTDSTGGVLSSLSPGATYRFYVETVATDGQTSTPESALVTLAATAPGAPKIQHVTALAHALRTTWAAPTSTGGSAITGYTVTLHCGSAVHIGHFSGSMRSGTVSGLKAAQSCVVRVQAKNKAGTSPPSAYKKATPLK